MTPVFLADNGSLRPEAFLNLRRVAGLLAERLGMEITPVSILHSDRIPSAALGGVGAVTLETALRAHARQGQAKAIVLPYFIGPSGALTWYLQERLVQMQSEGLPMTVTVAPFLSPGTELDDGMLAQIVAERVQETIIAKGLVRPPVVVVDHGSPAAAVTAVREVVAQQVAVLLGEQVATVQTASMERRPGDEFAFNEPLLERKLTQPGFDSGDVVVALLFLSPGRHAGPDGDVARICLTLQKHQPSLHTHMTGLVGTHPSVVAMLANRWQQLKSGHGHSYTGK
ncbi:MAG: cobalamin biosynthesis protein CbiX [Verrucomicrobiota bacterium]|nr:cobalamin biosynthesis protein CbiX [Verrucomicrobiota bacterium]